MKFPAECGLTILLVHVRVMCACMLIMIVSVSRSFWGSKSTLHSWWATFQSSFVSNTFTVVFIVFLTCTMEKVRFYDGSTLDIRVVRHISRGSRNRNYLKLRSCIYWALNKQLSFCKFSCRYGNILVLCCVLSCPVSKIKKIAIDICAVVRNHWLSQNK